MACGLELLGDTGGAVHVGLRPVVAPLSEPRIASLSRCGLISFRTVTLPHTAASSQFALVLPVLAQQCNSVASAGTAVQPGGVIDEEENCVGGTALNTARLISALMRSTFINRPPKLRRFGN
eukprot:scaffold93244_cov48-Phaeocystis_antarctica.AAC.4